jgi:CDP-diacylglycerol--glycerol-3-phosphate 3-phosphatidyltransferase
MRSPLLTPNQITSLRLLIFFGSSVLFALDLAPTAVLACFVVGGMTDRLDGWVARRFNLSSEFGKIYDQLSDKIVALFVMTAMVHRGILPVWFMGAVMLRDFVLSGVRDHALLVHGQVIGANWFGKRKADVQWMALLALVVAHRYGVQYELVRAVGMAAVLFMNYGSLLTYLGRRAGGAEPSVSTQ